MACLVGSVWNRRCFGLPGEIQPAPGEALQPDLLADFFAKRGKRPHHVGIVLQRGVMLNAPQTGTRVRIERVTGSRARTLVAAGRFAGLA